MAAPLLEYLVNGRVMERNGNRLSYAAPHGVYPCEGEDRWIAISVFTDEEWRSFCDVIGNPDWTKDPKFATLAGRKQSEDELDQLVGGWTKTHKAEDIEAAMQARGVAANVVEDNQDIYEDPQMKHRGHFQEVEHPEVGKVRGELPPFRLSKSSERHFRAPLLGEHNNLILSQFLGLSDDEISDLYAEGAITTDADLPQPKKQ
jgi:crotonobetainyl-CoA:carnitine CoA-transferase CaiB-like acyl-CoA transferase